MTTTLGDLHALQDRNEILVADNARMGQQVVEKEGRISDLMKERDSLLSFRALLEEKARKAAEDLAVMQERMMSLTNQKPVTAEDLQAALLRSENLALKEELESNRKYRQGEAHAREELSRQVDNLNVRVAASLTSALLITFLDATHRKQATVCQSRE